MYDAKHMSKLKKYGDLTPEAMKGFKEWNAAVLRTAPCPTRPRN